MVYYSSLNASNKQVLRYQVDLSTTAVPVGSTSDTLGLVVANLHSAIPGAEIIKVKLAGMKAVTAIAGATSVTALEVFTQKNTANNLAIPSSGNLKLSPGGGAVAIGTRDLEFGEDIATKTHVLFTGATADTFKLILAAAGAATVLGTASGIIEIAVEVEFTMAGLPRA